MDNYIDFRRDDAKQLIAKLTKMKDIIRKNIATKLKTTMTRGDINSINKMLIKIAHDYCHDDIWYDLEGESHDKLDTKLFPVKNKSDIVQFMKKTIKEYVAILCRYIADIRKNNLGEKHRDDMFNDMFNESENFFFKMKSLLAEMLAKSSATRKNTTIMPASQSTWREGVAMSVSKMTRKRVAK